MEKIPTLFMRGPNGKVVDQPHPDCGWVFAGEGVATEKLDGTNVRLTIRSGEIVRVEKRRNPTKEQKARGIVEPWYVDAVQDAQDKWIYEAVKATKTTSWPDGEHCCEAIGPNIQGNPLGLRTQICVPFNLVKYVYHWSNSFLFTHGDFHALLAHLDSLLSPGYLAEGIVFHHPDGRRAKIKRKDF